MKKPDRVKIGISIFKPLLDWARQEAAKKGLTLSGYLSTLVAGAKSAKEN